MQKILLIGLLTMSFNLCSEDLSDGAQNSVGFLEKIGLKKSAREKKLKEGADLAAKYAKQKATAGAFRNNNQKSPIEKLTEIGGKAIEIGGGCKNFDTLNSREKKSCAIMFNYMFNGLCEGKNIPAGAVPLVWQINKDSLIEQCTSYRATFNTPETTWMKHVPKSSGFSPAFSS